MGQHVISTTKGGEASMQFDCAYYGFVGETLFIAGSEKAAFTSFLCSG